MQVSHTPAAISISFEDPTLVSTAGLVPIMRLADKAGLTTLAQGRLSVPGDKGANAGAKITTLVAGMVAGADSIDDMNIVRHGGMHRLFDRIYAPSTLGSFLRAFTFGHVRQLDAVASRFLAGLATQAPALAPAASNDYVFVDVDDTIIDVHGHQKQGAGYGYSKVRADSAYYGHPSVSAAIKAGAEVSVTTRMTSTIKKAIATIADDGWQTIRYTDAIFDEDTGRWISSADVAEVPFTAFASKPEADQVPGRLVVRRILRAE